MTCFNSACVDPGTVCRRRVFSFNSAISIVINITVIIIIPRQTAHVQY